MPEYLRSLIIVLILSTAFFAFAKQTATTIIGQADFTARRNLWFGLTLAAFLSHSFWIYTFIAILLLLYTNRREKSPTELYYFVLFVLPVAFAKVPGLGLINFFFELSPPRILALFILLPAFFSLNGKSDSVPLGRTGYDKLLVAYCLLIAILHLRDSSITETLRQAFYLFMDIILPYFVFSRALKNLQTFKKTLLSMLLSIMLLALFAIFEAFKHWLLFRPLLGVLELSGGISTYMGRGGMLRAVASAGQPIALGYLMAVGIGVYLFLQRSFNRKIVRRLGIVLLVGGLIAPVSRGPWVGAIVLLLVFIATGRNPVKRLMSLALAGMLALPLLSILPGGEKVINLLPFVGSTEKSTIDYRGELVTNSLIVIQRNPWFGSVNFLETPEMQALMGGQGIIDVVNSYISITLESGFVGLGLFVCFFALVIIGVYRAMRSLQEKDSEERLLGRALLAILLSIMVMISTVSSITFIPFVYWSVAGMGVAYAQMIRKQAAENVVP